MNIEGMRFPCEYADIALFVEKNSHLDLQVNVLTLYEKNVFPCASFGKGENIVNILALRTESMEDSKVKEQKFVSGHFLLIKVLKKKQNFL